MSNSILTSSHIVNESLMELENQLVFSSSVNRQYDDQFAQSGAKKGDTINIRKPVQYVVSDGAALVIQDSVDVSVPLQLNYHKHVGLAFSNKDLTLSVDMFKERYITPAVTAIANNVDYLGYQDMYKAVPNFVGVPSASALPSTLKGFINAKAKISALGGPVDNLTAVVDPMVEASLVEGLKGLFQSSEQIKQQYEKGIMGYAAGSKFRMSQNVVKHTAGAPAGTPKISTTISTEGASTLALDGITGSITNCYKEGDIIEIANVYAVNPQTKQSTGQLMQFVVTANTNSSGGSISSLAISPAIYASGAKQNVNRYPTDEDAVTLFGAAITYASVVAPQNMVFHKDAFVLACADFELPKGMDMASRAKSKESGLSISFVRGYDINNHRTISRLDMLFGWKSVYGDQFACRVVGQPA